MPPQPWCLVVSGRFFLGRSLRCFLLLIRKIILWQGGVSLAEHRVRVLRSASCVCRSRHLDLDGTQLQRTRMARFLNTNETDCGHGSDEDGRAASQQSQQAKASTVGKDVGCEMVGAPLLAPSPLVGSTRSSQVVVGWMLLRYEEEEKRGVSRARILAGAQPRSVRAAGRRRGQRAEMELGTFAEEENVDGGEPRQPVRCCPLWPAVARCAVATASE